MSEYKSLLEDNGDKWKNIYVNNLKVNGSTTGLSQIKSPDTTASVTCTNLNSEVIALNGIGGQIQMNTLLGGSIEITPCVPGPVITMQPSVFDVTSDNGTKYLQVINDGVTVSSPSSVGLNVGGTQLSSNTSITNSVAGPPRMIFGRIDGVGATLLRGSYGISTVVKNSTGIWTITFTNAFLTPYPVFTVLPDVISGALCCYGIASSNISCQVSIVTTAGTGFDTSFSLIVFGI